MFEGKACYSIQEAMTAANAGRTSIYQAINEGALVARKRGRRTVILASDLQLWLEQLRPITPRAITQVK
jgi:hypothetical protein